MRFDRSAVAMLVTFLLTSTAASFSFAEDHVIVWEFPGYVLTVHTQPQASQDRDLMPMLIGKPRKRTPPKEEYFGIHFERDYRVSKNPGAFWVYELFHVEEGRPIKRISLDEAFGITTDAGCAMTSNEKRMVADVPQLRTTYQIRKGEYRVNLIRSIALNQDTALPTGRRLETVFEVQNNGDRSLNIRFFLRGRADGYAAVHDSANVFIVNVRKDVDDYPILIQNIRPGPRRVMAEPRSKENPNPTYEIEGSPIYVPSGQSREVMRVKVSATTAEGAEQAKQQAANLVAFLSGGVAEPDLMVMTFADKTDTQPGEVITYTILYHNIGTAPMKDVLLTNPIPVGASYVEGSAGGRDAEIEIKRSEPHVQTGTMGVATHIIWKIGRTVRPGEQGQVLFKVLVQ